MVGPAERKVPEQVVDPAGMNVLYETGARFRFPIQGCVAPLAHLLRGACRWVPLHRVQVETVASRIITDAEGVAWTISEVHPTPNSRGVTLVRDELRHG